MKQAIAQSIVNLVNDPIFKVLKPHENDYEGTGKFEVGIETEWGYMYWRKNYKSPLGNYDLRDGFSIISRTSTLKEIYYTLRAIISDNGLVLEQWDGGGNRDPEINISGIEYLNKLPDNLYTSGDWSPYLEIITKSIKEYFIPEVKKYLTYYDLYWHYYENVNRPRIRFESQSHLFSELDSTISEHYRVILKAMLRTSDYSYFKDSVYSVHLIEVQNKLTPYFQELEDLSASNVYSNCRYSSEFQVPYVDVKQIISNDLKVIEINEQKVNNHYIPLHLRNRNEYDSSKQFSSELSKSSYLRNTLYSLETFYINMYMPMMLRKIKLQQGLQLVSNSTNWDFSQLKYIFSDSNKSELIDFVVSEVKDHEHILSEGLDLILSDSFLNNLPKYPIINTGWLNRLEYQHKLKLSYDKKIKK